MSVSLPIYIKDNASVENLYLIPGVRLVCVRSSENCPCIYGSEYYLNYPIPSSYKTPVPFPYFNGLTEYSDSFLAFPIVFNAIKDFPTIPLPRSLISSKLWNEIREDIYISFYVLNKLLTTLTDANIYNYMNFIKDPYLILLNAQPYDFTYIYPAFKGERLTAEMFNNLVNGIVKLANTFNIQLPFPLEKVIPNEVVRVEHFYWLILNLDYVLSFAGNTLFVYFASYSPTQPVIIPVIKDRAIVNLVVENLNSGLAITGSSYVKNLVVYPMIYSTQLTEFINGCQVAIDVTYGSIEISGSSYVKNAVIGGANVVYISGNSLVKNITVSHTNLTINLSGNAIVENLTCEGSDVKVNISDNAIVINNNCA